MGKIKVVFGFVVVEDKDGGGVKLVFYGGVVEKFSEEDFGGGVDNNIAVGAPREVARDARPVGIVAEVFRNVDGAVERDFGGRIKSGNEIVEGESGAKRVAVGIFGLDDAESLFSFEKIYEGMIHTDIVS